jgi:hypothetical protein
VVQVVKRGGPVEYLRPLEFALYNPSVYQEMFEEKP